MRTLSRFLIPAIAATALASCSETDTTVTDNIMDIVEDDANEDSDTSDTDLSSNLPDNTVVDITDATDAGLILPTFANLEIIDSPLALRFFYQDKAVTAIESDLGSALYIWDSDSRTTVRLTGEPTKSADGEALVLTFATDDGRTAQVHISAAEQDTIQIRFSVDSMLETERLGMDFAVAADEAFYGLSERPIVSILQTQMDSEYTEGLDLRGQFINLLVYPTLAVYSPMYVSSAGYGVYVEEDWPGDYDFGTSDDEVVSILYESDPAAPSVTFRLIPGPTPLEVTKRYSQLVGTTILPPRWAFGNWRWRDDHYDLPNFYDGTPYDGPYNSMIVEDILMMDHFGIPCSVYWVDRPWGVGDFGYDDFIWDTVRLPEPVEMIDWLGSKDIKFMLWITAWAVGDMYDDAIEKDYVVKDQLPFGDPAGTLIDLTNTDAVTWWQDAMKPRIEDGVVGFKCDRGEEKVPDGKMTKPGTFFDGTSYREGHNAYPYWYAKAVHGAWQSAGIKDYVNIFRSAWKGSAQHAVMWGGDSKSNEWGLKSAIVGLQRSSVMNFPIWGSDTCGYDDMSSSEVCKRWLQFSAFSPMMEVGPTGNAAPWSWRPDGAYDLVGPEGYPYEPVYDEEMIAIWILYANIHQDLLDYTYARAIDASQDGTPIALPMIYAFPNHSEYKDMWDQYLYGPDILVAPMWQPGVTSREVHIPDGDWVDAWTGESVETNSVITVDAPIYKIPIYVKVDSDIDFGDLEQRWNNAKSKAADKPDLGTLGLTVQ